jgi:hypothetical protein
MAGECDMTYMDGIAYGTVPYTSINTPRALQEEGRWCVRWWQPQF